MPKRLELDVGGSVAAAAAVARATARVELEPALGHLWGQVGVLVALKKEKFSSYQVPSVPL